ncbi:MAG: isoprenylcysteine carboxylmethyltransferase family protein [Melioribacteraceae bacterium]
MKQIAKFLFKYRSYTPIPFVIAMLVFQQASIASILIGLAIVLTGEAFRLWGVIYAGSETRTTEHVGGTFLVISGAFGHLRNPLYLGNILIYVGVGIMSMALFPYLQIVAFLFFYFQYRLIISEEEEYLHKTFGKQFENYIKAVPRLIPSIKAYDADGVTQPPLNLKAGLRSERRTLQAIVIISILIIINYSVKNFA